MTLLRVCICGHSWAVRAHTRASSLLYAPTRARALSLSLLLTRALSLAQFLIYFSLTHWRRCVRTQTCMCPHATCSSSPLLISLPITCGASQSRRVANTPARIMARERVSTVVHIGTHTHLAQPRESTAVGVAIGRVCNTHKVTTRRSQWVVTTYGYYTALLMGQQP